MLKFQRNYRCILEIGIMPVGDFLHPKIEETIEIKYPITMNFNVKRNAFAEANTSSIQFLNIDPSYRTKLWKDSFNMEKYIGVELYAGYGDTMPLIFKGYVNSCYSVKKGGEVDFVTTIDATDAGYLLQYGFCNMTASKGSTMENIIQTLMNGVPDVKVGYLTDDFKNKQIKKDTTYIGQPLDLITRDYSQYQVFIDNGNLHVLGERDIIPNEEVYAITSNSGLLGSPRRNDTLVEADILFEPGLKVGQSVVLMSDSLENLNDTYKVVGISHQGLISATQSGQVTTNVTLNKGEGILNQLSKMSAGEDIKGSKEGWIKPVSARISSEFGYRQSPVAGASTYHKGLDYACPMNTPVKAIYNGVVTFNGQASGYGTAVYLNHGSIDGVRVVSEYGHLNSFTVYNGQQVKTGDIIAYSGNSGTSSGAHLHLTIRENGNAVNPHKYVG